MSNNAKPTGNWNFTAIMQDMATAWRLLWDPRVPGWLKLILPAAAALYVINPIDIPGPFDDIAVLVLALRFFVQLAPAVAVNNARGQAGEQPNNPTVRNDDNIVDTTWNVVDK